jgi:tetratricopeptide (TPR) repeat protein
LWEFYPHTAENERIFWQGCANAYFRFKYYDEALERIEKAYTIAPDNWRVKVIRGNILKGMADYVAALEMYDAALPLIPETDRFALKVVLNQKALVCGHLGRYEEAETLFEALLQSMPDAADAWFNRAVNMFEWSEITANEGQVQMALAYGQRALTYAQTASQSGLITLTAKSLIKDLQQHVEQLKGAI